MFSLIGLQRHTMNLLCCSGMVCFNMVNALFNVSNINKFMKDINDYIKLPLEQRQAHLKLDESCVERGGQSMYLKGLLAHLHDTTIPSGKKIHVCHACNNGACSNPNHLYWGTAQENAIDSYAHYGKTIWDRMVEKHGLEEARRLQSRTNSNGKGNAGKTKSAEHKAKIAEAIKAKWEAKKNADVA